MRAPIIVNDNAVKSRAGDVMVYETVESAQRASEPYDVDDQCLTYFDADGRLLRLELDGKTVRLKETEALPTHQSMLCSILKGFFFKVGLEELGLTKDWCDNANLDELVDKARQNFLAE